MEFEVTPGIEGDFRPAGQLQVPPLAQCLHACGYGIGIHVLGALALETQDHGLVGTVSLARCTQRAEHLDLHPGHPGE